MEKKEVIVSDIINQDGWGWTASVDEIVSSYKVES